MKPLKLESKKENFFLAWTIQRPAPPSKITVPLKQFSGLEAMPCVEEGTPVLAGQKIADPQHASDVCLHSSISGKVSRISHAIEIVSDGLDEKGAPAKEGNDRLEFFRSMGLVDMNLRMTPVHVKLAQKPEVLVLNACEPEPYIASTYALIMSHPLELLKGAEILREACGAKKILFVTETDKRESAELIKSKIYFLKWEQAEVLMLEPGYPDHESVLAKRLAMPSLAILDAATAFAAYEAVVLGKPLIERAVTVAGECVMDPKNLWLRTGTDLSAAVKICKGFMREPRKVLIGGPLGGRAQARLDIPVTAGTPGIVALPKEAVDTGDPGPCIRCGLCLEVCPAEISPAMISLAAENGLFKTAEAYGAALCIECGNCAYVCPSRRPMTELMREAKGIYEI